MLPAAAQEAPQQRQITSVTEGGRTRRQAEREGMSMRAVAQNAIRRYVTERDLAAGVDDALDALTPRYQNLLDRLGSV